MIKRKLTYLDLMIGLFVAVTLSGCGGTKILKEPIELPAEQVLSTAADERLQVELEWVIVRDGPGAWSSPADWDEYLLRLSNQGEEPLTIDEITLIDSLGERVQPEQKRKSLVRASKDNVKRYKGEGIKIEAGMSGSGLLGTGTALMVGGTYLGLQAAFGSLAGTAAGSALGWTGVAAAYAGPVLIVGGVVRGVNNVRVNSEIERRQLAMPFVVPGYGMHDAHVFYPISPSPELIEVRYSTPAGNYSLLLDTREALNGLHLEMPEHLENASAQASP